ncbi:MAG: hypothetical protein Q7S67_04650 [Telluria sp.]|nr:hypothetical protein [Telluria sp.]
MNPRHLAMGVALIGALALVVFGDRTPESDVAEAVERAPAARAAAGEARTAAGDPVILALEPRELLIGDGAMGGPEGVFGSQDWNPPPVALQQQPPPPPTAPPLPFTYFGKAAAEGSWEVYLARGNKTFVVRNNMVIDGMYRVDAIVPPNLTLTYLPLNQVQQLNIGVLD